MTAFPLFALSLAILQSAPATAPASPIDARAAECLQIAADDPVSAITTASSWLGEGATLGATYAHECLGHAYVRLLRWEAAEEEFLAARENETGDPARRARLAAMAGNAALAESRASDALVSLDAAREEAAAAGDPELAAQVEIDRARALVELGRPEPAADALTAARESQPQNAEAWLLSATLARRMERIGEAQAMIETAAALTPRDVQVALEAGVIAALGGRDDAARRNWEAVVEIAADEASVETAKAYLAQLDGEQEAAR